MEAITYIISDMFGISQASILPESNFYRDLGLDELDIVHLCIECEDVFDIEISVGSLENIFTVQDLHDIIRPKLYIV